MIESGAPFDKLVVSGPARAANWKSWGNATIPLGSDDVPKGAVVVLAPEKGSARSGHVGFFSRYFGTDRDQVELLGGNQSNTVTRTKFARSKIAAIRWHSPLEAKENEDTSAAIKASSPGQFGPLLDFIAQFESNRNYNAFFGSTINTNKPEFTAMTVDAVLDWQRNFVRKGSPSSAVGKYQFIRDTLLDLIVAGHARRDDLFDQKVQDKLAIALLKGRRLGKFLAGSISAVDFGVELAKEWASLPVPRDVARKNRLIKMGQSYYAGDGLNKALVAVPPFLAAINAIRT